MLRRQKNTYIVPISVDNIHLTPLHLSGLTPGLLRVIHKQVGHQTKVTQAVLADKWRGVCLSQVRDGRHNNSVN